MSLTTAIRTNARRAALLMLIIASPTPVWSQGDDLWRRTAVGWERTEDWRRLGGSRIPQLKPLSFETLLQRTWPATVALTQWMLVLSLLTLTSGTGAKPSGVSMEPAAEPGGSRRLRCNAESQH